MKNFNVNYDKMGNYYFITYYFTHKKFHNGSDCEEVTQDMLCLLK